MTGNEYQHLAMRFNDGYSLTRLSNKVKVSIEDKPVPEINLGEVIHGCLGLSGETGEFNDMIKKWIFHETPLDLEHAEKELGDVLWYATLICNAFGWHMEDVMQKNQDKLEARYPNGFEVERSWHRKAGDV